MSKIRQLSVQPPGTSPPGDGVLSRKKQAIRYPMRLKLIVAFLALAFIPLGVLFFINYGFVQDLLTRMAEQTLNVAAEKTAADIDTFVESSRTTVQEAALWPEVIAYLDRLKAGLPVEDADRDLVWKALLRLNRPDETDNSAYALLDSQGRNVLDTSEIDNTGQDESNYEYFSVPFQTGETYVSPVTFDPTGKQAFLYFSSPVRNSEEEIVGVLRVRYKADVLQQLIEAHNGLAGQSSYPILLDENYILLAHGAKPELKTKALDSSFKEGLDIATADGKSSFTVQLDDGGKSALATVKKLDTQLSWQVVFLQPQDAPLGLFRQHIFIMIVVMIVIAIVILVGVLNLSKILTSPLVNLATVAQQMASGALGLQAPVVSQDEVGQLGQHFNSLASQMRELSDNLEQYISERTRALGSIVRSLEKSTQIGRQITTILNVDELVRNVVNRIQLEFSFYYAQIYLFDEKTGELVLAGGSGEIGRQLKAQAARLKVGQGIVGAVASTNEFFLSNDVSKVFNYISSPLLSDTCSELALPLRKGNRVLGVLDIQDDEVNRFTSADVSLMQSIANQTAVAIDNARLLAETQTALKEVERLNRRLTHEVWDEFTEEVKTSGYHFSRGTSLPIPPDSDVYLLPMKQAAAQRQLVKRIDGGGRNKSEAELAVPLVLRGQVIGVLGVKREDIKDWAEEEVAAVEAVANQVTLALENARLSKEREKTIVQLKEVDRLKTEFLASMSHELRTPLNSIIGFADVILQGIDGEISEMAMHDVRLIYNSGQHLLALINDVLDLARIEAGKMELMLEPLDIEEIIEDVLGATHALVKSKPLEILTDIQEALPAIYADKLRLKQILINLVNNAIKFTREGAVTIKARVWEDNPSLALISVIDQGIGIPEKMLDTIFDRFRQVDSSSKREAEGSGLGLNICKQLVELHGGFIKVVSKEDEGSDFYFTIPFVDVIASEDKSVEAEVSH
jgi:signal transduction histidine kinase/HAMP domain-containing protein